MPDNSSLKDKLTEIENEIAALNLSKNVLLKRWEAEKSCITKIQSFKSQIEQLKQQAEIYERESNLAKVAEIRYGLIPDLNSKLIETNNELTIHQKNSKLLKEEVDEEDIANVISKSTGIPLTKLLCSERERLLNMEKNLQQRIIGQGNAIEVISDTIRRSRTGLNDGKRPLGSFMFLGTTGVGKTETALALAEFLFDDENYVIRLDMSEYMEKHSVSRLIGAPPGYVGYEEGGQLTEAIRRHSYSVILLDEIEKAHKDVFNILLQVLDAGKLTDSKGREVNFKNTIIIMTSNIGTDLIQKRTEKGLEQLDDNDDFKSEITTVLKEYFRQEFLNRIDEIIVFNPLSKENISQIAKLHISILERNLNKQGYKLDISHKALNRVAELGYDILNGARPLKRVIQKHLTNPISKIMISNMLKTDDTLYIDIDSGNEFVFSINSSSSQEIVLV